MNAYTDLTLKLQAGRRNFRDTDVRRLLCEMEALRATNAKLRQGQAEETKPVDLREPVTIRGKKYAVDSVKRMSRSRNVYFDGQVSWTLSVPVVYVEKVEE